MAPANKIEKIRLSYKPKNIKMLFIGESAPASGNFFYKIDNATKFTQHAFEKAFNINYPTTKKFLEEFRSLNCYLEDLCLKPINLMNNRKRKYFRERYVESLAERIKAASPQSIVVMLKSIEPYVRKAIAQSKLNDVREYYLPFPGQSHQAKYIKGLIDVLKKETKKGLFKKKSNKNKINSLKFNDRKALISRVPQLKGKKGENGDVRHILIFVFP